MNRYDNLESKLRDYYRFTVTLLILACYLYMGAVINTYIQYSQDGSGLSLLSFAAVLMAGFFCFRSYHIQTKRHR